MKNIVATLFKSLLVVILVPTFVLLILISIPLILLLITVYSYVAGRHGAEAKWYYSMYAPKTLKKTGIFKDMTQTIDEKTPDSALDVECKVLESQVKEEEGEKEAKH